MNPIALYLASGEALYPGALLLLLALAATPWLNNPWLLRLRSLAFWLGIALMAASCPPFPFWLDTLFAALVIAWLAAQRDPRKITLPARRFRLAAGILLALLTLTLAALELPHRARPTLTGPRANHLVVIGDSISAGLGREPPWPAALQHLTGIPVTNLAQPGAQASDALAQARKLTPADTLVLLEIGGNDLLAATTTADFQTALDQLLAASAAPGRTLIMFELPLLPHRPGYGIVQRQLAAKYHVQLIPKRFLVEVIGSPDATSDGLHLSPAGAQRMAQLVSELLRPFLEK